MSPRRFARISWLIASLLAVVLGVWLWNLYLLQRKDTDFSRSKASASPQSLQGINVNQPSSSIGSANQQTVPAPLLDRLSQYLDKLSGDFDLSTLDALSSEFYTTSALTREEKVMYLLHRAMRDPSVFGAAEQYCYDMLSSLQPIEFASNLIAAYRQATHSDARIALIDVLRSSAVSHLPPDATNPERLASLEQNVPMVEAFYTELLHSGDMAILADVLRAYCDIVPPNDSAEMALSVVKEWIDAAEVGEVDIDQVSHINLLQQLVSSGLSTPETQDRVFAMLPTLLDQFTAEDLSTFNEYLYRVVAGADLTPSAQSNLLSYLESQKPKPTATSTFYHWANAISRVGGGEDPFGRLAMIANRTRQSQSPLDIASAIVYGPAEMLGTFSGTEILQIKNRLSSYSLTAGAEASQFAETAVLTIDEYLAGKANESPLLAK